MKESLNLLDDLENHLDGDWKKIYQDFQEEEYKKEIEEPVIPIDFPSYDDFYNCLVNASVSNGRMHSLDFEHLVYRILKYQDRKKSESFDNIWNMFCDPYRYQIINNKECEHCNKKYSIVTNIERNRRGFSMEFGRSNMMVKQEKVHCPSCGHVLLFITGGEVVGVFENRRV